MEAREQSFRVRMSDEERSMLAELAEDLGVTASDWVRMAVRKAHAEKKPKPKKK